MEDIGIFLTYEEIYNQPKNKFKSIVKSKIRQHVFNEQVDIKLAHSKVRKIVHTNLNTRLPRLVTKRAVFCFFLSCISVNEFKSNFLHSDQHVLCFVCKKLDDTQKHALECNDLNRHVTKHHETLFNIVNYVDLYGS